MLNEKKKSQIIFYVSEIKYKYYKNYSFYIIRFYFSLNFSYFVIYFCQFDYFCIYIYIYI